MDLQLAGKTALITGAARGMGAAARRFVVENMSWDSVYAQLPQILAPVKAGQDAT